MESNSIYFTRKKFDEVWGRVSPDIRADEDTLKTLMDYEYTDFNIYRALSRRYTGTLSLRFSEMANDEMRHYTTLKAKYYLLTGKVYKSIQSVQLTQRELKDILKTRYVAECEAYEGYAKAAKSVLDADLAGICLRNAEDEKRHAYAVLTLLGNELK